MSKKLARNAIEILLMLEDSNRDKVDVLFAIKAETGSSYTVQAVNELITELKEKDQKNPLSR